MPVCVHSNDVFQLRYRHKVKIDFYDRFTININLNNMILGNLIEKPEHFANPIFFISAKL
jgi:hypothetical protein